MDMCGFLKRGEGEEERRGEERGKEGRKEGRKEGKEERGERKKERKKERKGEKINKNNEWRYGEPNKKLKGGRGGGEEINEATYKFLLPFTVFSAQSPPRW